MARKFSLQPSVLEPELARYLSIAARVSITGAVRGVCRDPKDDMVLEAALHANANIILTGDRDLLFLGHFHTARILTARTYLEEKSAQLESEQDTLPKQCHFDRITRSFILVRSGEAWIS